MALKDPGGVIKMKQMMSSSPGLIEKVIVLIHSVLIDSLHDVFFISIISSFIALVCAILLKEIPLRGGREKEIAVID